MAGSPSIEQIVAQIRSAIFGRDVRENIALGIETCYSESTASGQIERIVEKGTETLNSIPQSYDNLDFEAKSTALDTFKKSDKAVYYCTLRNGSVVNPDNLNCVSTVDFVPVKKGQTVQCYTLNSFKSITNTRTFGYALFDSACNLIINVDFGFSTRNSRVKIQYDNAAYIKYAIAEYYVTPQSSSAVPIRITDFNKNDVFVTVEDDATLYKEFYDVENSGIRKIDNYIYGNWADEESQNPYIIIDKKRICPREFIQIKQGDTVTVNPGSYNASICYWAVDKDDNHVTRLLDVTITELIKTYAPYDGFCIVSFRDKNNPSSTAMDLNAFDGEIYITSHSKKKANEIYNANEHIREYCTLMGNFTWGSNSPNKPITYYYSKRVGTAQVIELNPMDVIHIRNGSNYSHMIGLFTENKDVYTTIRNDLNWFKSDEDIEVHEKCYFVICFSNKNNHDADINFNDFDGSVYIDRMVNKIKENEQALNTAINGKKHVETNAGSSRDNAHNSEPKDNLATFIHMSDVHGDSYEFSNGYYIADYLKATAVIASGDLVYLRSTDNFSYVVNTVNEHKSPFIMSIGNHESYLLTAAQQRSTFIDPFIESQNYTVPDISNATYYYKDFDDKKIRIISVNQFEYKGSLPNTDTYRHMTQEQATWFCDTLLSTPTGYGVIIVDHSPEKGISSNETYNKFVDKIVSYDGIGFNLLTEVVDAFISGTSISKTFYNLEDADPASVTVDVDFSNKNSGTEFIAFINGHMHTDKIGYIRDTENMQLQLNVTCTNSWTCMNYDGTRSTDGTSQNPWLTELSDLNRDDQSINKTAINVYSIDRKNKKVRITRIGANTPCTFDDKRDYMAIPYAES